MQSAYAINGVVIKRPTTFKIERYKVTNLERIANGDMVGDLLSKKLKFYFTYESISAAELNNILDILWETDAIFYTLQYVENNVVKTAQVYPGSIPSELHRTGGEWIWKDLTFNLIEQ